MKTNDSFDLRRIDEETMEGPIVDSVFDDDFYKFSMGQFIWNHPEYKNTRVKWQFKNRSTKIKLGEFISEKDFMEQIEPLQKKFGMDNSANRYMRGLEIYGASMFSEQYLDFLKVIQFPTINFGKTNDGQLSIDWDDLWNVSMHGEMPTLRILSGLFVRSLLKKMSKLEREVVYATGICRLAEKIKFLRRHPYTTFSDFSNRRTPSPILHEYVVTRTAEELGKQFRGTSKTSLAMKHGLDPIGTWAHELAMVITALMFDGTRESIEKAQIRLHTEWLATYGEGIALSLPDTYGTEFTLNCLPDEIIRRLKGVRIDSMDPMKAIPLIQARFTKAGADYKQKLYVPSDELSVEKMIAISTAFAGKGIISHGIGGGFGNDFGLPKPSIVCKPIMADQYPCVKISDNFEKAIGEKTIIEDYMEALGLSVPV